MPEEPAACQPGERVQYAALPFRRERRLEILLLTSRETGRWVLPKGWPMKGKDGRAAAKREALEEAGVAGRIARAPLGAFHYPKRLGNGEVVTCEVYVFPLEVRRQRKNWPEQQQRTQRWFTPEEAAEAVQEPELAALLSRFDPPSTKKAPATTRG